MMDNTELLLGVFPNLELAESAVDELGHAGYSENEIGIMTAGGKIEHPKLPTAQVEDAAAEGAEAGALTGGSLGVLAGAIAVAVLPGIGLAVTGGILTVLATSAAAGAALGVFAGPFVAMGLSEHESAYFTSRIKAGRTIVAVKVADQQQQDEVVTLLRSRGATEVRTRDGQVLASLELVAGVN